MKDLRRFMNPKSRVIVSDTKIRQTELLEETTFNRLLTEEEQKKILEQDYRRRRFERKELFHCLCSERIKGRARFRL